MSANDRQYERDDYGDHAEAPALVGGFAYDKATDRWTWSAEVYRIHGFEPHDVVPTTELMRYHLHPDEGEAILVTLWQAMAARAPFSEHFRVVDARGTTRNVLALGTGDTGSRSGLGLRGQLVDLSDMHHEILRNDVGPAVEEFQAHRAVIEQAKGILIQMLAVDADEAFDRMRAYSQHANVKVRFLAECLVAAATKDRTDPTEGPGLTVDELFAIFSEATSDER
ncbi:PAS and ANTAR domain-containing protein [Nocardioides cynanchi]|uniref:PAS and ANTAR domain-containing protein n=1 Tax=Nocardioides cynanchi TaxID=2558918 RepID=UPI00177FC3D7|nr:PAS and ANTAR domain-containing protein [Nocardioides cynanchi]